MKAIILAAGGGTRLAPIGVTTPKLLIPILNRTILEHHIEALQDLVDEVIIVIGPNLFGQLIQQHIDAHPWPIKISTVIQEKPLGTAHAYQAAASMCTSPEPLICLNGDDLYSAQDLAHLAEFDYAILGQPVTDPDKWGILQLNPEGYLQKLVEKPTEHIGNLANTGAFVATSEIFDLFHQINPSLRGEYEVTDTLTLLAQKRQVKAISVQDYWLPVGYPWHILQVHQTLLARHSNNFQSSHFPGAIIKGNVHIGPNVTIEAGATLDGNIIIGENSHIAADTLIAGNTVIGPNVEIKSTAIINHSTIFAGTIIGRNARIIYSVVGKKVNIGDNVVTMSQLPAQKIITTRIGDKEIETGLTNWGAVIGDNAIIQDQVIIHPGVKIWPHTSITASHPIKEDNMT